MAERTMADVMLEAASHDAAAYRALVRNTGIHDSILGFHAQQAVEKALKAVLFRHGVLVPRTHHIDQLLDALADAGVPAPPHADTIDTLNPYAVQARYGTLHTAALDRKVVAAWMHEVLAWAGVPPDGSEPP
jgi:HEPN domain-containing protein